MATSFHVVMGSLQAYSQAIGDLSPSVLWGLAVATCCYFSPQVTGNGLLGSSPPVMTQFFCSSHTSLLQLFTLLGTNDETMSH